VTTPLSFTLEQAAERLGGAFTVDWLKSRIKRREIPFGKTGNGDGRAGRIYLTQQHLERILAQFSQEPPAADPELERVTRRRSA
jgi:hypothetical protein